MSRSSGVGTRNARQGADALRTMGEHMGSGLAMLCELPAGALTGSGYAGPGERHHGNGMLSIYMNPSNFESADAFFAET